MYMIDATPRMSSSLPCIQLRTVVLFIGSGGGAKVHSNVIKRAQTTTHRHLQVGRCTHI